MDWETIKRHYRMKNLPRHEEEINWFASQPTLRDTINKAALAENHSGKRYRHQCRIPHAILQLSLNKLCMAEKAIGACSSFEDLHRFIILKLKSISGIGELYCYDTALRIGAKLNLHPKTVFLHAGTRQGASFITDIRGKESLNTSCLPMAIRELPPEQVEDILCIYKDEIKKMHNKGNTADR
ncbi:MAG: hypothetical protein WC405_01440 [Syntrophales bacterium]